MPPIILPSADNEKEKSFYRLSETLADGGLIAFPTDTFYALGADPFNSAAVDSLYRIKRRPTRKPVMLLISDISWAEKIWGKLDRRAIALMERFWPGPLTIVCPPGPQAPILPGSGGLALRMPGNTLTVSLLSYLNIPLTGTSANPSGKPPPRSADEVARYFSDRPKAVSFILDGGTFRGPSGSTIIGLSPEGLAIIREGLIQTCSLYEVVDEKYWKKY